MPVETGTATDFKDLLAKLRTFALAQGWVSEAYTTGAGVDDPDYLYLRGPGVTTSEKVHINIATYAEDINNIYCWELYGATAYDSGTPMTSQPGTSPPNVIFLCADTTITYWFYVNDRRIMLMTKVGTRYYGAYMGFFLPWGSPADYPFPLYISGNVDIREDQTSTRAGRRNFWDPGYLAAYIRSPSGSWMTVANHADNSSEDSFVSYTTTNYQYWCHPYITGFVSSGFRNSWPTGIGLRPIPNEANTGVLLPIDLYSLDWQNPDLGFLDGVYYTHGFNLLPEQTYVQGDANSTGVLTLTGNAVNNETVTIGEAVQAFSSLTGSANAADGDTVTLDAKTYTFQATLTNVDGNVHIGTDLNDTLTNLVAAITLGAGSGTDYAAATTLHPTVTAASEGPSSMSVTAKTGGTAGNSIATTETSANLSFPDTTLNNGTDAQVYTWKTTLTTAADEVLIGATASDSIDNLIVAINGGPGESTVYGTGTEQNAYVTATAGAGDTMDLIARVAGSNGNNIDTTETMTNGSFGSATLTGGGGNVTYRIFQNVFRTGENHFAAIEEI